LKAGKGRKPAVVKKPAAGPKAGRPGPDASLIAALVLIIAIIAYAAYYIQSSVVMPSSAYSPPQAGECSGNETGQCLIGQCAGIRTCQNGTWSRCALKMACEPGSSAPCYEGACVNSYKVCNGCGTGYGPCINNSG